jgi:hypothetical protein
MIVCGLLAIGAVTGQEEWRAHGGSLYHFGPASSQCTYADCRDICQGLGADLVTIQSDEESAFIASINDNDPNLGYDIFWLSIYETTRSVPGTWVINPQSTEEITYFNWRSTDPDLVDEQCAAVYGGSGLYKWGDNPCTHTRNYICEKPDPCMTSPCQNGGTCSSSSCDAPYTCSCLPRYTGLYCETQLEWIEHAGSKYYFGPVASKSNQPDCRNICQGLGADLITITSDEETAFIASINDNDPNLGYDIFWLSIFETTSSVPGTWVVNPDSTEEITYFNWRSTDPNLVNERCAAAYSGSFLYKWGDNPCTTSTRNYICEKSGI